MNLTKKLYLIILTVFFAVMITPSYALDFQSMGVFGKASEVEIGDINNDGFGDVVILSGSLSSGTIQVYLGPDRTFFKSIHLPFTSLNGHHIAIGDINNDNFDDVVTSYARDTAAGEGELRVYFGPSLTSVTTIPNPEPNPQQGLGTHFGIAVASGDVNNDGTDDIVVGARNSDNGPISRVGAAFVYLGPSLSSPTKIFNPPSPNIVFDNFGTQVEAGKGFVVVSDPISFVTTNSRPRGDVHVFSGTTFSLIKTLTSGNANDEVFGDRLAVGDINNDGNDDIIAKGWFKDVFFFLGPGFTSVTQKIDPLGAVSSHSFGSGIATGDADNDGDDDVIVGALGSEKAYVYEAPGLSLAATLSEPSFTTFFGHRVAFGDVDGDAREDVVVAGFVQSFYFKSIATCVPPVSGDWMITTSCNLANTATAPANVIVSSGVVFTIPSGLSLTVPSSEGLMVEAGGGVIVVFGGNIFFT